jgi:ppGpp synthetase/RelA/SpoT-type nucleotidyltranferase
LPGKANFLGKYRISAAEFDDSGLRWIDLQTIFADYSRWCAQLAPEAECLAAILRQCPEVHAAKSRAKKPESLIEKIIRKSVEKRAPWASPSNYVKVVPDLIGVRALHLIQAEWPAVNKFIRRTWPVKQRPKPVAYIQKPIPTRIRSTFAEGGCTVKIGEDGYQSVHYEMARQVGTHDIRVEVQARTLYQEAWGEISHVTAYPHRKDVVLLVKSMRKLAEVTIKADHFTSVIAGLSQLSDAIAARQRPSPQVVDAYVELLAFLLAHYPEVGAELAQASSIPSLERLAASLFG